MKKNEELEDLITSSKKILNLVYIVFVILVIFLFFYIGKHFSLFSVFFKFLNTLSPIFIGFVVAWLFNPLAKKLKAKNIHPLLASIIVYLLIFLGIYVFLMLFVPLVTSQINDLIKLLPDTFNSINSVASSFFNKLSEYGISVSKAQTTFNNNIEQYFTTITKELPNFIVLKITGIILFLKETFLGLLIGFYILVDFDKFYEQFIKLIPKKQRKSSEELFDRLGFETRKTINGTLLLAFLVFILNAIGFVSIGLKGSIILALFCGLVDLIPFIGPYIGVFTVTVIGFTMSSFIGLAALIISSVVQLIENVVLRPVIMSKLTDLNPVIILSGLLIFAHLFGLIGMIFAVPLLAILKVIINHFKTHIPYINSLGEK